MNNFVRPLVRLLPKSIKKLGKKYFNPFVYYEPTWRNNYNDIVSRAIEKPCSSSYNVCIVKDVMMRHAYYEAACKELGIKYDLLDVGSAHWLENMDNKKYDVMFIRPFVLTSYGKKAYDEITYLADTVKGHNVFPSKNDLWMYESKVRCAYILKTFNIPHPQTHIFNDYSKAIDFIEHADFPLIFKTDIGSDASGVIIVKNKIQGMKLVKKCFGKGFINYSFDTNDRQVGSILFQEFLENVREIRVIRIGNSYFAYEKGKQGDFHSGSKIVLYIKPEIELLEFVRTLTDKIPTECMSVDIFKNSKGEYFVNELQTYYGANEPGGYYFEDGKNIYFNPGETHEMRIDGVNGRYYYHDGKWEFQEGDFARNAGCNLRVVLAFQQIGKNIESYNA